jgi:hypothetical protein
MGFTESLLGFYGVRIPLNSGISNFIDIVLANRTGRSSKYKVATEGS